MIYPNATGTIGRKTRRPRPPASLRNAATAPAQSSAATAAPAEQPARNAAPAARPVNRRAQEARQAIRAIQPQLFNINSKGDLIQTTPVDVPTLKSDSTLEVGFWWFRSHLESLNRPKNTIASYMYDLSGFAEQ